MARPRILFVDDEPNIRLTLPAVLHMHGFDVHSVGTVADALAAMQDARYDVLIADLNIGQPGDGFTVVSAMRRTQTHAVTIILTGYPAFETALKAIREQVDDYVVKPAQVESLVRMIHDHLANNNRHEPVPGRRVALILKENQKSVIDRWLSLVKGPGSEGTAPYRP